MRREAHGGCGERLGETGRGQPRDRAPGLLNHDVEVMGRGREGAGEEAAAGGAAGMAQLHGLVGGLLGEEADGAEVVVGIETDRGPWSRRWLPRVTGCSR